MKNNLPYQNFPSFILRSPLFPLKFLDSLLSDKKTSEDQLKEVYKRSDVQEAIFLGSPNLSYKLNKWIKGELTDLKEKDRLPYSFMRYLLRMSTRPTPFGLFAGFSIGQWREKTEIKFPLQSEYKRHTRLDMNYLCALALDLAKHPAIKGKIKYYPNSSIYVFGDQLRYVEYRYKESKRTHHIVAVDFSKYLDCVLNAASTGAYLKELAEVLTDDEISFEEAEDFIEELIDSQILVNDLEPAITGPEFLEQILSVLESINGLDNIKKIILKVKSSIEKIDRSAIGTTLSLYTQIAEDLKTLETGYELKYLFQTDMVKPTISCTLKEGIVDDVLKGIEVMNKLTLKPSNTYLEQFKNTFYERYEDREVPLLQALDTESGVGYRQGTDVGGDLSPLVDDIDLPAMGESYDIKWNNVQSFLLKKYLKALSEKKYEIELTDEDLKPFSAQWDDLPDTISTMVSILKEKDGTDEREKILIESGGGSSAANLLGRFCHADRETEKFVKEITEKEKELNPDTILAEIIHLPESRIGNILLRPVLRNYEIPYLAKSAVPDQFQIKLEDLMVSVRGNRIVLRSKKLNKEIIPRLSSAHNYSFNALPVYHFLCDLQVQNKRGGVGFNWGALANEYPFLPRVTYKNLILSLAKWNFTTDDVKSFLKIKDEEELYLSIQKWRNKYRIPPYVSLVDGDNELFINLENLVCIKTLLSLIKKRQGFLLVEFLFNPENSVVRSEEGAFSNEFILSFYRKDLSKKMDE